MILSFLVTIAQKTHHSKFLQTNVPLGFWFLKVMLWNRKRMKIESFYFCVTGIVFNNEACHQKNNYFWLSTQNGPIALFKDLSILILDEATCSLDAEWIHQGIHSVISVFNNMFVIIIYLFFFLFLSFYTSYLY